jgi:RNA polymerase sigma factor (sigma-70 family)
MSPGDPIDNRGAQLFERLRDGDPDAERELNPLYQTRIHALGMVRTRDAQFAEELVSDTMAAVLAGIRAGHVPNSAALTPFVYGVARQLVREWMQRRGDDANAESEDSGVSDIGDSDFGPARKELERRRTAAEAISHLGSRDKRILFMRLVEGRKLSDIGSAEGLPAFMIRRRNARALENAIERMRSAPASGSQ